MSAYSGILAPEIMLNVHESISYNHFRFNKDKLK